MDCDYIFHYVIYITTMPLIFLSMCLTLPLFLIYKLIKTISGYFSCENMNGKVVLITGASSGIGEHMAYEYAKRGASLVIVARRESRLQKVAETARELGSPDVLLVCANVSNIDDCKRAVDEAISRFGRLDHLVNNAGIATGVLFDQVKDVTKFVSLMDINFWGSVYPTHFAIPYLKRSKGRIIAVSAAGAMLNPPRMSFYLATKSAMISFYEALRVELAPEIKTTIVLPGFVESEMTQGKLLNKNGITELQPEIKDLLPTLPFMSSKTCASAIVREICRGERYVTEPKWYKNLFIMKAVFPELFEWYFSTFMFNSNEKITSTPTNN